MSTETEIKVRIGDPDEFRRRLEALNPVRLSGRHFEDNYLLDFPDGRLRAAQSLLRIRFEEGKCLLTYKGPPRPEGVFKVREELETGFEDGNALLEILGRIGMKPGFRYQKYREEFSLGDVRVAIDETPVGNYVELEGPEEEIRRRAAAMAIEEAQFLRSSYYSLYLDYCRETGKTPEFMVF